jgi:hypothetical protein
MTEDVSGDGFPFEHYLVLEETVTARTAELAEDELLRLVVWVYLEAGFPQGRLAVEGVGLVVLFRRSKLVAASGAAHHFLALAVFYGQISVDSHPSLVTSLLAVPSVFPSPLTGEG